MGLPANLLIILSIFSVSGLPHENMQKIYNLVNQGLDRVVICLIGKIITFLIRISVYGSLFRYQTAHITPLSNIGNLNSINKEILFQHQIPHFHRCQNRSIIKRLTI